MRHPPLPAPSASIRYWLIMVFPNSLFEQGNGGLSYFLLRCSSTSKLISSFIAPNRCMAWYAFHSCPPSLVKSVLDSFCYSNHSLLPRGRSRMPNSGNRCLSIRVNCDIRWNVVVNNLFHPIGDCFDFAVECTFNFPKRSIIVINLYLFTPTLM
jgi:hypothetical protein